MSRSYNPRLIKENYVYSIEDLERVLNICRNTAYNWDKNGLRPIDEKKPRLYRGAEVKRFLEARRARTFSQLMSGQFKCFACKSAVFPEPITLNFQEPETGAPTAWATCPDCSASVSKRLNQTEYDRLKKCRESNTSLYMPDEGIADVPACIGHSAPSEPLRVCPTNERILYEWLPYARKYSKTTIDAHLRSIRYFERFCDLKPFEKVKSYDVARWRDELCASAARPNADDGLSRSTVRHHASHMKRFFEWLSSRGGFEHLRGHAGYCDLPKKFAYCPDNDREKVYPTMEEAKRLLLALPKASLKDKRDRAIFALAFVAGLREGALSSLRWGHVDVERRKIRHDGVELRAKKNGKTFTVDFFPRTEVFQDVFAQWENTSKGLGLGPEDAVFPNEKHLKQIAAGRRPSQGPVPIMKSASAVDAVFKRVSEAAGTSYTPHSARHAIAAL